MYAQTVSFDKEILWGPQVESVLLDMDGTLLDRHFDDYFWEDFVPEYYAEKNGLDLGSARDTLMRTYKDHEGTLNWTDIDFWSNELGMDIHALKQELKHLIEVHPYVEDFLEALKNRGKRVFLVTDAHSKVVDLKMKETGLDRYFDARITCFEIGFPKEDMRFWERAEETLSIGKGKTLFIDDREKILITAKRFGIEYTIYKAGANSKRKEIRPPQFPAITEYRELLDGIPASPSG
ncbi:MAG: GMP/IMP nucleotidase [Pseudomonadota bacterium]